MNVNQQAAITYLAANPGHTLEQTADEFNQPSGLYATHDGSALLTKSQVNEMVGAGRIKLKRHSCYELS